MQKKKLSHPIETGLLCSINARRNTWFQIGGAPPYYRFCDQENLSVPFLWAYCPSHFLDLRSMDFFEAQAVVYGKPFESEMNLVATTAVADS